MSGYKTHRLSQEPDDYEGPWPEGDSMTEWVMVPREPTEAMLRAGQGSALTEHVWKHMLDAAPAAPQQAEPVAQIGWADEFGNLFPMGAWKPTQRTHHDSHKTVWRPVFLHPPAAEVQRLKQERDGLKNRLEWRHDGGPDGISARDETIKMQDAEVQRLARDFNRLKAAATAVTTALYDRERLFAVAELRAALAALEGGE